MKAALASIAVLLALLQTTTAAPNWDSVSDLRDSIAADVFAHEVTYERPDTAFPPAKTSVDQDTSHKELNGRQAADNILPFVLRALNGPSFLIGRGVEAVEGSFWISGGGKRPTINCQTSDPLCSAKQTGSTGYNYSGGSVDLYVTVPGSQSVYLNATTGALAYTPAGAVQTALTSGAIKAGFSITNDEQPSALLPPGRAGRPGFLACPASDSASAAPEQGLYQVFANVAQVSAPLGDVAACLEFDARCFTIRGDVTAPYSYG